MGAMGFSIASYEAAWVPDDKNTALSLRYHAADVFPHGADIEKKVELDGDEVQRELSRGSALQTKERREGRSLAGGSAAVFHCHSVRSGARRARPADEVLLVGRFAERRYCAAEERCCGSAERRRPWRQRRRQSTARISCPAALRWKFPPMPIISKCGRWVARGSLSIGIPDGLTIEPKRYSALLDLHSPVLKPGEETRTTLRFHVLAPD